MIGRAGVSVPVLLIKGNSARSPDEGALLSFFLHCRLSLSSRDTQPPGSAVGYSIMTAALTSQDVRSTAWIYQPHTLEGTLTISSFSPWALLFPV